ncbi:zinc finger CCCH domain-containing protein 4-like [Elaeis guineensis]|uniref:zinc finger CCCH domain-containing protein 4-like n=1 Tax=Elaeis guineensis var. tenera TaxID=51953 RepID=UPI003C6CD491
MVEATGPIDGDVMVLVVKFDGGAGIGLTEGEEAVEDEGVIDDVKAVEGVELVVLGLKRDNVEEGDIVIGMEVTEVTVAGGDGTDDQHAVKEAIVLEEGMGHPNSVGLHQSGPQAFCIRNKNPTKTSRHGGNVAPNPPGNTRGREIEQHQNALKLLYSRFSPLLSAAPKMGKDWESSSVASSSYSASTSASSSGSRPPLPVMALRRKIVEKIQENRVTLIVGDTGCGKSSQVPQFLLEENMEPILCTQPRRFAVVAIARMVAKARNCDVGGEIGYHIGHSNVSDINLTRIVFKTAGVLLEQMRDMGLAALRYKVIILDEVHERSVESDLVLACLKQFMIKNNDLRVVLMSATADITRYKDYFKDLGRGERVEVIAIPSASQHIVFQRKVLYLEQVISVVS